MATRALGFAPAARPNDARSALLAWPGWPHLAYATALGAANGLWFMLVFAGCDWITGLHAHRVRVHFDAELAIPFVAAMTAVYMSMYLAFAAGPFILRSRREVRALVATLAAIIAVAGVTFLLVPAQLAFAPVGEDALGSWAALYRIADDLNLTYNLVPSLHVALTVACVAAFAPHAGRAARAGLWTWAAAVAASTLLTHQHHAIDVAAGWALALAAHRFVYRRLAP